MTDQEKKLDIINTIQWLLDKGDFEDWETAYSCGMNSINMLDKAINFTDSSLQLKEKKETDFEKWLKDNTVKTEHNNIYLHSQSLWTKKQLLKVYELVK